MGRTNSREEGNDFSEDRASSSRLCRRFRGLCRRTVRAWRPCRRKTSLALWDHWVPNANNATKKLIEEWAAREKVDVSIDFITSQGNKLLPTGAAESQAKSGHDVFAFPTWLPSRYADLLVPMNDVMEPLIK